MIYLFTKCVKKSCDSPDWLIQSCYQSASTHVTETASINWPCAECLQKCFSAEIIIILSLNTVIPIIFYFILLRRNKNYLLSKLLNLGNQIYYLELSTVMMYMSTVLPAKSGSHVMFCIHCYQGLRIDRSLMH